VPALQLHQLSKSFTHTPAVNAISLSLRLQWDATTLPELVQWYMPGQGEHVLGLEPANCRVEGRAAERARGSLVILEPGESRRYTLSLEVFVANQSR